MFKKLKTEIERKSKDKHLSKIKLKDIKFTIRHKYGKDYNKDFPNHIRWNAEQIKVREDIKNHNYKPENNNYPTVSSDNVCLDGYHRLTSLIEYYDGEFEITVYRNTNKYANLFFNLIFYYIFFQKRK
jgi:hypothetical protein